MGGEFLDAAERHLPRFLSAQDKSELLSQLRHFESAPLFGHPATTTQPALQGDGWRGLSVLRFDTGEKRQVSGVIVSNACDIAGDNVRHLQPRVVFAPIVRLAKVEEGLRTDGFSEEVINDIALSMRKQRTTSAFFLPKQQHGPEEDSLILLDDLHSVPVSSFHPDTQERVFRLSQMGFWLFLIKLSIHFCRMNDGVVRG